MAEARHKQLLSMLCKTQFATHCTGKVDKDNKQYYNKQYEEKLPDRYLTVKYKSAFKKHFLMRGAKLDGLLVWVK
jgi:hypothetical protein